MRSWTSTSVHECAVQVHIRSSTYTSVREGPAPSSRQRIISRLGVNQWFPLMVILDPGGVSSRSVLNPSSCPRQATISVLIAPARATLDAEVYGAIAVVGPGHVAGLPGQMKLMADLQTSTVLHVRGAMAGTGIGIKVTACDHLC